LSEKGRDVLPVRDKEKQIPRYARNDQETKKNSHGFTWIHTNQKIHLCSGELSSGEVNNYEA